MLFAQDRQGTQEGDESAIFLAAARSPTATARATADDWGGTVVLVKTASRAEAVRRAVDLLGANPVRGTLVRPEVILAGRDRKARQDVHILTGFAASEKFAAEILPLIT